MRSENLGEKLGFALAKSTKFEKHRISPILWTFVKIVVKHTKDTLDATLLTLLS